MTLPTMDRRAAVKKLLDVRDGALVVTGLGSPSYDVHAAGDRDDNYYLWGAMGGAALVGLGLAQAQPQRRVMVITGDGEQLMAFGSLATISVARPRNLDLIVLDNQHFGETGMQSSHTGRGIGFDKVATACGFADVAELRSLEEVDALCERLRRPAEGPRLFVLKIAAENLPRSLPPRDAVAVKNRFRAHLGFGNLLRTTMPLVSFQNTVGGRLQAIAGTFESFDPFTGRPWALIRAAAGTEVDAAVASAKAAFRSKEWGGITPTARGKLLVRLAELIAENAERIAAIETRDNGKLITEMTAQLRYIPEWFRYFGGLADKIEGSVLPIDKAGMFAFTRHEPLGVIAAIVPWNSPLLLLTWKLAPLLAAGNTVVIKPSEHASASTLEFVKLFAQAGFPPGVVNTVTGMPQDVGVPLVSHPDVAKIAFTGGEPGGLAVYRAAAEGLKTVTLELGGKSANIVFADADLDSAVNGAISGIFAASGQTCIAGSRLLVQRNIHDRFVEGVITLAASARMGNPALPETQVGPITTQAQREKVLSYLGIARREGALCVLGGGKPRSDTLADGWFVEPSIFTGVNNSMRIAREEVFGPILSVIPFDDEEEAFAIANDSPYGLAAGLWTSDMGGALRGAAAMEAGMVWINSYRAVSYMAPFGGYKRSGIGRESGQEAINAYLQTKTVWIDTVGKTSNPFVIR